MRAGGRGENDLVLTLGCLHRSRQGGIEVVAGGGIFSVGVWWIGAAGAIDVYGGAALFRFG